jgi:hypothetical protein
VSPVSPGYSQLDAQTWMSNRQICQQCSSCAPEARSRHLIPYTKYKPKPDKDTDKLSGVSAKRSHGGSMLRCC